MSSPAQPPHHRSSGWWRGRAARWLLAALTFVVGLFLGGLIVGFVSHGSSTPSAQVTVTATPTKTPSNGPTASDGLSAQANVSAACLRAVNDAQSSYGRLSALVSALRSLNVSRIDHVIQQLEPLQSRLQHDIRACKIRTQLPDGSITTRGPSVAAPSPSTS